MDHQGPTLVCETARASAPPLALGFHPTRLAAPEPQQLRRLGRFQVVRSLGAGASAVVFEVVDPSTRQRRALKLLRSDAPVSRARLEREYLALAELEHPNLVAVDELVITRTRTPLAFFTMELVRGLSFLEYVRSGAHAGCDVPRLQSCLAQLAHGLAYLHARGMRHCDLKPANVLVRSCGQLSIVDFGLVHEDGQPPLEPEAFLGTPAYAAPEQMEASDVTEASDWYAVGVMIYEALSGRRPFLGNSLRVLELKARHDPPPPSRFGRAKSPQLERVCMQLLARDPAERMQGVQRLAALADA